MQKSFILGTIASILLTSAAHAAVPCEKQAMSVVKAIIVATNGSEVDKEVEYTITDKKVVGKDQSITVLALGLNGEDSDTAKEYTLTFRVYKNKCDTLKSVELISEN